MDLNLDFPMQRVVSLFSGFSRKLFSHAAVKFVWRREVLIKPSCSQWQLSTYAIRDVEEYKNFCDRPKDQRPLPEEVIGVSLLQFTNF